jgi:hypothetical protein
VPAAWATPIPRHADVGTAPKVCTSFTDVVLAVSA